VRAGRHTHRERDGYRARERDRARERERERELYYDQRLATHTHTHIHARTHTHAHTYTHSLTHSFRYRQTYLCLAQEGRPTTVSEREGVRWPARRKTKLHGPRKVPGDRRFSDESRLVCGDPHPATVSTQAPRHACVYVCVHMCVSKEENGDGPGWAWCSLSLSLPPTQACSYTHSLSVSAHTVGIVAQAEAHRLCCCLCSSWRIRDGRCIGACRGGRHRLLKLLFLCRSRDRYRECPQGRGCPSLSLSLSHTYTHTRTLFSLTHSHTHIGRGAYGSKGGLGAIVDRRHGLRHPIDCFRCCCCCCCCYRRFVFSRVRCRRQRGEAGGEGGRRVAEQRCKTHARVLARQYMQELPLTALIVRRGRRRLGCGMCESERGGDREREREGRAPTQ
jgi:hypothetical protein